MAMLEIAKLGNPILRRVAEPITLEELRRPEIQQFIDDMVETMYKSDGVGLAAPQVFLSKQIVVLGTQDNPRYPDAPPIPLTVLVNPVFTYQSEQQVEGWEGCLSLDNLRGSVPRSQHVRVKAQDRGGRELQIEAYDFMARVIQHEVDHLNGKVFIDQMKDLTTLTHLKEFETYWYREPVPVA
jgi:peptide deformylase